MQHLTDRQYNDEGGEEEEEEEGAGAGSRVEKGEEGAEGEGDYQDDAREYAGGAGRRGSPSSSSRDHPHHVSKLAHQKSIYLGSLRGPAGAGEGGEVQQVDGSRGGRCWVIGSRGWETGEEEGGGGKDD